jgi:hypothetical protein
VTNIRWEEHENFLIDGNEIKILEHPYTSDAVLPTLKLTWNKCLPRLVVDFNYPNKKAGRYIDFFVENISEENILEENREKYRYSHCSNIYYPGGVNSGKEFKYGAKNTISIVLQNESDGPVVYFLKDGSIVFKHLMSDSSFIVGCWVKVEYCRVKFTSDCRKYVEEITNYNKRIST